MHNITYSSYPVNVNKKNVQSEWDNVVVHEDYLEGATGLPHPIRWLDVTCNSREEAEAYIDSHDSGWYDQLAVKYVDKSACKETAKETELSKRAKTLREKYMQKCAFAFADNKSAFRGCAKCNSKIARAYLTRNTCPVCGADLRSETAITAERNAYTAWQKVLKELDAEKEKRKGGVVKWLVKTEYHT